jgi:hypothetical protein
LSSPPNNRRNGFRDHPARRVAEYVDVKRSSLNDVENGVYQIARVDGGEPIQVPTLPG